MAQEQNKREDPGESQSRDPNAFGSDPRTTNPGSNLDAYSSGPVSGFRATRAEQNGTNSSWSGSPSSRPSQGVPAAGISEWSLHFSGSGPSAHVKELVEWMHLDQDHNRSWIMNSHSALSKSSGQKEIPLLIANCSTQGVNQKSLFRIFSKNPQYFSIFWFWAVFAPKAV
ncbi:hypothetical protein DFH07DRAFT_763633 [Mycena maculata]|uniref:Uncharacterized protein n=1 Tax=Mycena maculata TaxID=230809 RepID=A0AAD7KH09_9AGAR|nr:hypothetical protein DFH07DRAFT_763633 [Mycena maculata]